MDEGQIRLTVCMLIIFPLSLLIPWLKIKVRLPISILLAFLIQAYIFREQVILLWFYQNSSYLLLKYLPRRIAGKAMFSYGFAYLSLVQMRRMYLTYGAEIIDVTLTIMPQVFNIISMGFNYQDGASETAEKNPRIITFLPNYFSYIHYLQFLPCCLIGPVFQYTDFDNYINNRANYCRLPQIRKSLNAILQPIIAETKTLVFCVGLFMISMMYVPLSYVLTAQYQNLGLLYKSGYVLLSVTLIRFKFYTAWSLTMLSVHATGITLNEASAEGKQIIKWDRIVANHIWNLETQPSIKKKLDSWNIGIQTALKRYVYQRLYTHDPQLPESKNKSRMQLAQYTTMLVSAVWHGLYPGYYLSFLHWVLILQISQQVFRAAKAQKRLQKLRGQLFYLELLVSNYLFSFHATFFLLMTGQKILFLLKAHYCLPMLFTYILYLLVVKLKILRRLYKKKLQ